MIQCPDCKRIIIDSTTHGGYKVRTRMLVIEEGSVTAICPSCKTTVDLPLMVDVSGLPPFSTSKPYTARQA